MNYKLITMNKKMKGRKAEKNNRATLRTTIAAIKPQKSMVLIVKLSSHRLNIRIFQLCFQARQKRRTASPRITMFEKTPTNPRP